VPVPVFAGHFILIFLPGIFFAPDMDALPGRMISFTVLLFALVYLLFEADSARTL